MGQTGSVSALLGDFLKASKSHPIHVSLNLRSNLLCMSLKLISYGWTLAYGAVGMFLFQVQALVQTDLLQCSSSN